MPAWRFRQCPACGIVLAAAEFAVNQTFRPGWQSGGIKRRCPSCGHTSPTWRFRVVRERHSAGAR